MNLDNYYTFEELRELGCPNELLIQYVFIPKVEIDRMLELAQTEEM